MPHAAHDSTRPTAETPQHPCIWNVNQGLQFVAKKTLESMSLWHCLSHAGYHPCEVEGMVLWSGAMANGVIVYCHCPCIPSLMEVAFLSNWNLEYSELNFTTSETKQNPNFCQDKMNWQISRTRFNSPNTKKWPCWMSSHG